MWSIAQFVQYMSPGTLLEYANELIRLSMSSETVSNGDALLELVTGLSEGAVESVAACRFVRDVESVAARRFMRDVESVAARLFTQAVESVSTCARIHVHTYIYHCLHT